MHRFILLYEINDSPKNQPTNQRNINEWAYRRVGGGANLWMYESPCLLTCRKSTKDGPIAGQFTDSPIKYINE